MEYIVEFQSTFENVDAQAREVCSILNAQPRKPNGKFMFTINYVLRELLNNAVEHGNKMDKEASIKYKIVYNRDMLKIEVWDQGKGFHLDSSIKGENNNETLRERNRGLKSIISLGFQLKTIEGGISAVYLFDKNDQEMEGEVKLMDISLENRKLICVMHTNLVSMSIKELILKLKPYLENIESFDTFLMDMKEVKGIDSMGITFLIGVYKTLKTQNKVMSLSGVSDPMLNLFKIMKLDEVFEVQNA